MELFYSDHIEAGFCHLGAEESNHCVRVLRHREGDALCVIDGGGTMYECTLCDVSPKEAVARIEKANPNWGAHPYRLTMAVCPTKNNERYEWFAEKATEVGVDVIAPVIGQHSERRVLKTGRLQKIVLSAAKQSLKALVPEVEGPVGVKEFIASAPAGALKLIACCFEDEGERASIKEVLKASETREIVVLIGPEGDFSAEEVRAALAAGFKAVHLGDSRLRTETAALAAVMAVYFRHV